MDIPAQTLARIYTTLSILLLLSTHAVLTKPSRYRCIPPQHVAIHPLSTCTALQAWLAIKIIIARYSLSALYWVLSASSNDVQDSRLSAQYRSYGRRRHHGRRRVPHLHQQVRLTSSTSRIDFRLYRHIHTCFNALFTAVSRISIECRDNRQLQRSSAKKQTKCHVRTVSFPVQVCCSATRSKLWRDRGMRRKDENRSKSLHEMC